MALNNIREVSFDGATGRVRFGSSAMRCTKVDMPKESRKSENIRHIGETVARTRTVGVWDVDDGNVEMLSSTFSREILPRLPIRGGSLIDFPITVTQRHPLVEGPYSVILDRCNFFGIEEALAWEPTEDGGSLAAQALMF